MMMDLYRFGAAASVEPVAVKASESDTKECPVCHARLFSDMNVCYGCLHSFASDSEQGKEASSSIELGIDGVERSELEDAFKMVEFPLASEVIGDASSPDGNGTFDRDAALQVCEGNEVEGVAVPTVEMHIAEGQQAAIRLGQVLQVVISVQVARDACRRREP